MLRLLLQRTNLNASLTAFASGRDLLGPLDRLVEILAVQNVVTCELLLGFCKRSIESNCSPILGTNRSRGARRLQRLGAMQYAFLTSLPHDSPMAAHDLLQRLGSRLLVLV